MIRKVFLFFCIWLISCGLVCAQQYITVSEVGNGWAQNSVNTTIFRKNSLTTFQDFQYTAYYDGEGCVILGKRKLNDKNWTTKKTSFKGNVRDAHNVISIAVDGEGFLHVSWDHHNSKLRYARSNFSESLELGDEQMMINENEKSVSYPEFLNLPTGDLLFLYRDGGSGGGNLVMNHYSIKTGKWNRLQDNLLNGEGKRNAYWQAYIDKKGWIHISWVWRESPNVASNHDLAYAVSKDFGCTWQNSLGRIYDLPIDYSTAEYAVKIPENSALINQTSMGADDKGNPFIVSYWQNSDETTPQYKLVYNIDGTWNSKSFDFRKEPFVLGGFGTKEIPMSRPQIFVRGNGKNSSVDILFREKERGHKMSVLRIADLKKDSYSVVDILQDDLGAWEPTIDTELWKKKKKASVFVQSVSQVDGEGIADRESTLIKVVDWKP